MQRLISIARSQHGVLTKAQFRGAGFGDADWRRGVADGRLHPVHRGIARVDGFPHTDDLEIMAGVLAGGASALASHRSALALWGCDVPTDQVDVLLTHANARPRSRSDVHFHRTRAMTDLAASTRRGIPVTSAPRALVDLGEVRPDLVFGALADLAVSRLVTPSAARAVALRHARQGRAGAAALGRALSRWPGGVEDPDSRFEVDLAVALVDAGLGDFRFHPILCGLEVDFAFPERLVVETDGWEHHGGRDAFESDRDRDAHLTSHGWRVQRVTWLQFQADPAKVVDRIRRARLS